MGKAFATAYSVILHPINYRSGEFNTHDSSSAGAYADFIKPANQGDIDHVLDKILMNIDREPEILKGLLIPGLHLVAFWAGAVTNQGVRRTKLVGMADQDVFTDMHEGIEWTPDNLWFKNRAHAIAVASLMTELADK